MDNLWAVIAGLVSLGVLLGGLARFLHLGQTGRHLRLFLLDWLGESARPGVEARPSFPERMAKVEKRTEVLQHDFATETVGRLVLIGETVERLETAAYGNADSIARVDFRLNGLDRRISDHRQRNEEQIEALRSEVERRINQLSPDQAQYQMMRATLAELGIDIDLTNTQSASGATPYQPERRINPPERR